MRDEMTSVLYERRQQVRRAFIFRRESVRVTFIRAIHYRFYTLSDRVTDADRVAEDS